MKTALITTLCALALSAPAVAQTPPPNQGQVLTQEYAALYREYLDKKKLGLDAEAQAKYGEFLTAFRKHRLLARGITSGPTDPGEGGGTSGRPGPVQPSTPPGDGGINPDEGTQGTIPVGGDNGGSSTTIH